MSLDVNPSFDTTSSWLLHTLLKILKSRETLRCYQFGDGGLCERTFGIMCADGLYRVSNTLNRAHQHLSCPAVYCSFELLSFSFNQNIYKLHVFVLIIHISKHIDYNAFSVLNVNTLPVLKSLNVNKCNLCILLWSSVAQSFHCTVEFFKWISNSL